MYLEDMECTYKCIQAYLSIHDVQGILQSLETTAFLFPWAV